LGRLKAVFAGQTACPLNAKSIPELTGRRQKDCLVSVSLSGIARALRRNPVVAAMQIDPISDTISMGRLR
jgi:hypothetical protein